MEANPETGCERSHRYAGWEEGLSGVPGWMMAILWVDMAPPGK